ncbi:polymeric immunoglobulin receptor-like [Megalops cyprinoides]|uniref:polymeric immunoglobulin receptor-like n=1 Tax=Megalops cyprinoides TaxID=118141 RepID=UPI0018650F60|nr:polymeric immunoglobulin receptor-like [Megalops cyprinoides]
MAPLIFILFILTGADGLRTVSRLTVQEWAYVTIPCYYDQNYKAHVKYWCRGYHWHNCATIVRTDSPQTTGKVSITDDPAQQVFTVTLNDLQVKDSGYYWCGVEINVGRDDGERLHLTVTEGTPDLSVVRDMVTGEVGGIVRVFCRYGDRLKDEEKMWCRFGEWISCLTAGGSGTSQDKVNLHVNHTQRLLTVAVRELERKDTGWYWCSAGDLQIPVHISVTNKPTVTTASTPTKHRADPKMCRRFEDSEQCTTIVHTDTPQRKENVSVTDGPAQQVFTVTLNDLQVKDSGYYWCGVDINVGRDDGERLHLTVTEGTPDLSVVKNMVTGEVGGIVRVFCRYGDRLKDKEKMWCRIGDQISCLTAGGSGTSQDRVNLHVNHTQRLLTVTVRELERKDTGWYWCSAGGLQIPVHISVTNKPTVTTAAISLLFLTCTIISAMIVRDQ